MLTVFFCLPTCRKDAKPIDSKFIMVEPIKLRHAIYCELSYPNYLEKKYVVDECDGAGFTSLYSLGCLGYDVDLHDFQTETGRMNRSPDPERCWDYDNHVSAGSDAGYSKDHVLMRAIAAYEHADIHWFDMFLKYLDDNHWVFCEAKDDVIKLSKCVMSPKLYVLLYDAREKLKTKKTKPIDTEGSDDSLVIPLLDVKTGFEGHLDVLSIWFSGRIYAAITKDQKKRLKAYAEREPKNGLYQAVAFIYGEASYDSVVASLIDEKLFPRDKLPSNHENYCTDYLFQRDYMKGTEINKDWLPCTEKEFKYHSATEYVFTHYILERM